ncbi:MAG TPA: aminoglycoside phosphotransferase family protein [Acidimicrobiales bacterium]|nr:aminoglycoside phosphotransferase family protein [Acidimicrobiales bacterium]
MLERAGPPAEALRWVERTAGRGATTVGWRRLRGGIASVVHRVRLAYIDGSHGSVVLRRFLRDDWGDPSVFIAEEVQVLRALENADIGVAVPHLLGASITGEGAGGRPALLMEHVPGRVHLRPRDGAHWLGQMAHTGARIHQVSIDAKPFESWLEIEKLRVPSNATRPDLWRVAHGALREQSPSYTPRLVHRDYQHFNLLWVRDRLAAVLDWGSACLGPADVDVGHCRLNLAVLFSPEWAEEFLRMYEAEAGAMVDPWWDLAELCVYGDDWPRFIPMQVAGRTSVDTAGMTARVEAVIEATLDRLSN